MCVISGANAEEERVKSKEVSWHEFKSHAGRFSIDFPTPPTIRTTHQESIIGHVTNHVFESKTELGRFSMDYSDLPGFAVSFTGSKTIYRHATGALLKKSLGKIQSSQDVKYQGYSGKYLIYDIPYAPGQIEHDGHAYLFLIDKRMYVVNAITPAGTSSLQVKHFMNSLHLD